ncbi:HP1 family phage holin [Sodalis sp. RH19]|uniref:HP1 family phage holin n=1 Tax=Sodalis sp. RH19 TaxID=3394334 RepID=UPI0039B634A4
MERVTTALSYFFAALLAWFGGLTPEYKALLVGAAIGVGTFLVNWYYRRKSYVLLARHGLCRGAYEEHHR